MELRIQNLSKRYPNGTQALQDVTLTIKPGMFGLLGPNGAGKSTLMRTLATLQEADSGSATLGGIDVLKDKDAVRRVLGYLPQDFGLYPSLSAEQMLDYLATLKGLVDRTERRRLVGALLERVNLSAVRTRRLGGFSGGMRQRFGIAQALIGRPRLIIVDEPTAGLDPEERYRFQNLLAELAGDIVIVLSTHIVSDVTALCRQMAIIKDGSILHTGTPAEAVARMRGRVWERIVPRGQVEPYRVRFSVISTRPVVEGIRVRVLHEGGAPPMPRAAPGEVDAGTPFESAEPTLEDVYFAFTAERAALAAGA